MNTHGYEILVPRKILKLEVAVDRMNLRLHLSK
jgi:hypothetical protein